MRHTRLFLFVILVSVLAGCNQKSANTFVREGNQYAHWFQLQDSADFQILTIFSPWDNGNEMAKYYLTQDTNLTLVGKTVIHTPIHRIITASCTHIGFLSALNCTDLLVGVCNPELIYTPLSIASEQSEGIINMGDAMTPNIERITLAHPDIMFISTYAQGDATATQLVKMGVPVLYVNEWIEKHPLARAEWIKVFGALTNRKQMADSIYSSVVDKYTNLCEDAKNLSPVRPSIMSGQDFRGTWYVPAGDTYMGVLFKDAGAKYKYQDKTYEGSIPLSLEQAIIDFADEADVWVGSNARSLKQLEQINAQHTQFKAFKNKRVYNFLHRSTPAGANDFWERGVVHPEEMLGDLIHILYHDNFEWENIFIEQLSD